jgi:D-alanyl-D-alanine carboxypeptidase
VSQKYPVLNRDGKVYLPALSLLDELGVVAVQENAMTLLAVTEDQNIHHLSGTREVSLNEQTISLSQPSVQENGSIYVLSSFFEEVLSARVEDNAGEINISLAMPDIYERLKVLNTLKQSAGYFRAGYLWRYADYIREQSDLDPEKAVIYVNAKLDKPFYTDIEVITQPEGILALVNKYCQIPADYEPKNLMHVEGAFYLRTEVVAAYREMTQAAALQNLTFKVQSAYRCYATQRVLYNNYVARSGKAQAETFSARPGHSEHQTGLAIDITQPTGGVVSPGTAGFEKTPQYAWLIAHAHEYGFILRYPKDKTDVTGFIYEPWHYRYVGKDVAGIIYEQGLTLEEYLAMYQVED